MVRRRIFLPPTAAFDTENELFHAPAFRLSLDDSRGLTLGMDLRPHRDDKLAYPFETAEASL